MPNINDVHIHRLSYLETANGKSQWECEVCGIVFIETEEHNGG